MVRSLGEHGAAGAPERNGRVRVPADHRIETVKQAEQLVQRVLEHSAPVVVPKMRKQDDRIRALGVHRGHDAQQRSHRLLDHCVTDKTETAPVRYLRMSDADKRNPPAAHIRDDERLHTLERRWRTAAPLAVGADDRAGEPRDVGLERLGAPVEIMVPEVPDADIKRVERVDDCRAAREEAVGRALERVAVVDKDRARVRRALLLDQRGELEDAADALVALVVRHRQQIPVQIGRVKYGDAFCRRGQRKACADAGNGGRNYTGTTPRDGCAAVAPGPVICNACVHRRCSSRPILRDYSRCTPRPGCSSRLP